MQQALIVFVRHPEQGKVKTRLAAAIGALNALKIYQRLLDHTLDVIRQTEAQKFIFYAGKVVEKDMWQLPGFTKSRQEEGDLGLRMKTAFEQVFKAGYRKVVIIGSDCPGLTPLHLQSAFAALETHAVVIGPATDGGYYLLGMHTLYPELFEQKQWSTDSVYSDTIRSIEKYHLPYYVLEPLTDVDEEKDLPLHWKI